MKILITGAAGFIGFHLSKKILKEKSHVIGIDNLNSYYDVNLKKNRVIKLNKYKNFQFYKFDSLYQFLTRYQVFQHEYACLK